MRRRRGWSLEQQRAAGVTAGGPTPGSAGPHVAGPGQPLEDAQLSGPAEVEAVVRGQVRRLSVEARLGGEEGGEGGDIAHFLP